MKRFTIVLASVLSAIVLTDSVQGQPATRTWISNVTIISPDSLDHIGTGSVLIENGRIVRVERRKHPTVPDAAAIVSGKGRFLIPGLIDSHVHLAGIPGVDENSGNHKPRPEVIREYFEQL